MIAPKLWYPERWCERYLGYCSPPFDGPPHYPKMPPRIAIVDLAALHLTGKNLKLWRRCRTNALAQWEWGGLILPVYEVDKPYRKGKITIDVTPTEDGTNGQAFFGADPDDEEMPLPGAGWAHVDDTFFAQAVLSGYGFQRISGVLCHELGHTLGFGHDEGPLGTGIMTPKPTGSVSQEEIDAMRSYWFQ